VFSKGLNNKSTIKYEYVGYIKYIPLIFYRKPEDDPLGPKLVACC